MSLGNFELSGRKTPLRLVLGVKPTGLGLRWPTGYDVWCVAGLLGYFKRQHRHVPSRPRCCSLKCPSQVCIHDRAAAGKTVLCGAAQQPHVVCDGRLGQAPGLFNVGAMLVCWSNSYKADSSQITHIFKQTIYRFSIFLKETRNQNLKEFIKHKIFARHIYFWT